MKKSRILAIILALSMALAIFAGCNGGNDNNTNAPAPANTGNGTPTTTGVGSPAQQGEEVPDLPAPPPEGADFAENIVLVMSDRVQTLDSTNPGTTALITQWIYLLYLDTLVKLMPDGSFAPSLATSWETNDYQTYTFRLRDDVYFHNGEHFTADDVAFSIERAKNAPGTQIFEKIGAPVASYEVVNDYEIVLTLNQMNLDFIYDIAWQACGIQNRRAVTTDPDHGSWIGTGAWMVSEFVPGEYTTFQRNDNYWGDVPVTKFLTLRSVAEETARFIMLENGEAQVQWQPNPTYMPTIVADPNLDYIPITVNNTMCLGFNLLDPITGDINFRRAVASAIDLDALLTVSLDGWGVSPDHGTFWGYRTEFKNTDIPQIPRDLDKAREYLAASSYNGESVEIASSNPYSAVQAQVILSNLSEIGINITLSEPDGPTFAANTAWGNTGHQMFTTGNEWQACASSVRTMFYPGMTSNRANYNNPEVARLLDQAAMTTDDAQREALYRSAQELIAEDIPYLLIVNMTMVIAVRQGIGGIMVYPNNCHDLSGIFMEIQ